MRPNWFIALKVDPSDWYAELIAEGAPRRVRTFAPEDLHSTIAFLGGVDEDIARAAWTRAAEDPPAAATVRFRAIEPFGNPRRPSALSITLGEGGEPIVDYMRTHTNDILEAAGRGPERREPRPHITIARPHRKARNKERRRAVEWAQGLPLDTAREHRIDRMALYTWSDDRSKRKFKTVEELELSDGATTFSARRRTRSAGASTAQPFTTPIGRIRATTAPMPARSTASTTDATSL